MDKEEWGDVVGYEGIYQVSNRGRVKRTARGPSTWPGRVLTAHADGAGYLRICLCKDGIQQHQYVHCMVAETFLGTRPSLNHQVNHKNGVKDDNHIENLEWTTRAENVRHSFDVLNRSAPKGEAVWTSKLTPDDVKKIRHLYATNKHNQVDLAEIFGVTRAEIGYIVRGDMWQHVGGPISLATEFPLRGENNPSAKLTPHDVQQIRRLYAIGEYTHAEIGEMFGIEQSHIGRIIRRESWRHVP